MRETTAAVGPSLANCALYLGLEGEPAELGLDRANLWHLGVEPRRAQESMAAWVRGETSEPSVFFVSSPCVNDPTWTTRRPGRSSVVALFNAPWEPFAAWADEKRGRRGAEYEAFKARLTREALAAVLRERPEIADAVDHVEMSTPVTTRSFTGHARGEMAGLDHTPLHFSRG